MATDDEYDYDFSKYKDSGIISNIKNNLDLVTISDWVMLALVAFSIFILSGLIFIFTEAPEFLGRDIRGTQFIFNLPATNEGQANPAGLSRMYVSELLIVAGVIALGVVGLYLIRNATRFVDEREKGVQILAIGVILFLMALFLLFLLFNFKQTSQFPNISGVRE
jgi:glucan phosphoethanolaminetransferase (alkaline phosphatase superfamily)